MATITLKAADRFPAGTTVAAYPLSNWLQSQLPTTGAPQGASTASAVVAADGSLALTGLAEGTKYVAYALVGAEHRYVRFRTARAGLDGSSDTIAVSGSVSAPAAFAQICLLTPPPGVYDVEAQLVLTGTAETKLQNVSLVRNVTILTAVPSLTGIVSPVRMKRVTIAAGDTLYLFANAAATAGAIYNGGITATRIE